MLPSPPHQLTLPPSPSPLSHPPSPSPPLPMALDAKRLIWTADWYINDVELPLSLPAPVCTPHPLCSKAAQKIRRHTGVRSGDDKLLLHWVLRDAGLVVQGGDYVRLILKASYTLTESEAAAGSLDSSRTSASSPSSSRTGMFARHSSAKTVGSAGGKAGVKESTRRRHKEKKQNTYEWSSSHRAVRFYTRERRVYVQQLVSGMSAQIKSAHPGVRSFVDCHQSGEYAIEVEELSLPGSTNTGEKGPTGSTRSSYVVNSLTLRFERNEIEHELKKLTAEGLAAAHLVDVSGDGDGGGVGLEQLMPEMVRNLDTGEVLHMTEIEDRVTLGVQPQSLRPLARPVVSRGWLANLLGLDLPSVPLEPCLKPLPLLSISGELLTGRPLRCVIARDRFRVGDGFASSLASSIREVRWLRHRAFTDDGEIVHRGPAEEPYVLSADDVGCAMSVQWQAGPGVVVRAETAQIQPRPGLRDAVDTLLAAGKASFDVRVSC